MPIDAQRPPATSRSAGRSRAIVGPVHSGPTARNARRERVWPNTGTRSPFGIVSNRIDPVGGEVGKLRALTVRLKTAIEEMERQL